MKRTLKVAVTLILLLPLLERIASPAVNLLIIEYTPAILIIAIIFDFSDLVDRNIHSMWKRVRPYFILMFNHIVDKIFPEG